MNKLPSGQDVPRSETDIQFMDQSNNTAGRRQKFHRVQIHDWADSKREQVKIVK
jgi:hypothetical protein